MPLPGSLLLWRAAGLLAAHVLLHFPRWLLCCLQFKRKEFKLWLVRTQPKLWDAQDTLGARQSCLPPANFRAGQEMSGSIQATGNSFLLDEGLTVACQLAVAPQF